MQVGVGEGVLVGVFVGVRVGVGVGVGVLVGIGGMGGSPALENVMCSHCATWARACFCHALPSHPTRHKIAGLPSWAITMSPTQLVNAEAGAPTNRLLP